MCVLLTSFNISIKIEKMFPNIEMFSVSRWRPKGFNNYKTLENLGAYDKHGQKLTLNNGIDTYKKELFKAYVKNWKWIEKWLTELSNDNIIGLCCWCPYSKSTKLQIKTYGSFVCHTGLIGKMINKYRPDIEILLDMDRHKRLIPEWKPQNY